jgi:hypothetical protein
MITLSLVLVRVGIYRVKLIFLKCAFKRTNIPHKSSTIVTIVFRGQPTRATLRT